jgi:peptide/nickel transport system permease protein
MSEEQTTPKFESVDWTEVEQSRQILTPQRVTLLVCLTVLGALLMYDRLFAHVYLVLDWEVERIEWLFLAAIALIISYIIVPMYRNRERTRRVYAELRSSRLTTFALAYLAIFFAAGVLAPLVLPESLLNPGYQYNPPPGLTTEVHRQCAGAERYRGLETVCRGSIRFPLGTGILGRRVEHLVFAGTRPALYVLAIGGLFVIPIATIVGVAAGLRGGLLDRLLLTYVDLQLSLPAILIYFVAFLTVAEGASLLLFLIAFGLLSWGGPARLVRSEVIQRRERGHVTVARSLGGSELYVAKRHIVPNITNTLIPAIAHVLALLLLYEAGLSFLGFYDPNLQTWGTTIGQSVNASIPSPHIERPGVSGWSIWWVSTFPALALTLTMLSLKVVGDGLRDALDPRGEQ